MAEGDETISSISSHEQGEVPTMSTQANEKASVSEMFACLKSGTVKSKTKFQLKAIAETDDHGLLTSKTTEQEQFIDPKKKDSGDKVYFP